ncbi:MAG: acyltransferase [Bacteroidota bacterium]
MRAIAILLVLVWHYFTCQISEDMLTGPAVYLKFALSWTWSGVDLFFVLSGFLIGSILLWNKGSHNYFTTFYARRMLRIFPPYYLVLLVFVFVLASDLSAFLPWLTDDPKPLYAYFLYIQNFWMLNDMGANWMGVTWSLAIEEQFYLLLPLLVFLIPGRSLPGLLLAGIVLAPFCRALIPELGAYVLLPSRMDSLLMGVLIGYYYLNGELQRFFDGKRAVLWMLLFILPLAVYALRLLRGEDMGGVFIHSLLCLFYGAFIVLALISPAGSFMAQFLSAAAFAFLARISYMVYLTHQVFSGLFHQLMRGQQPQIQTAADAWVTLLALCSTILFSAAAYYIFERPVLRLGKNFTY